MNFIKQGNTIIISAHGNSIRAIIMELFSYSPDLILKTEIGWCEPWIIDFNSNMSIKDFKILNIYKESKSNIPLEPILSKIEAI